MTYWMFGLIETFKSISCFFYLLTWLLKKLKTTQVARSPSLGAAQLQSTHAELLPNTASGRVPGGVTGMSM